jgi:hypothetical protein
LSFALLFLPVLLFVAVVLLTLPVLVRLLRLGHLREVTPEWLESFSVAVYYPMEGLLSNEDFLFLSRQPGFDLALCRKLRRDRLRIFRQYFNRLIGDFNRLHKTARFLLANSSEDRSELIPHLVWLKVRFFFSILRVEARYLSCYIGFRSLSAGALIQRLDEMRSQLTIIASASPLRATPFSPR